jgi:hypothetical protein
MKLTLLLLVVCAASPVGLAQQKRTSARPATSTVSGHVYCADTNAPARMASVILQPADQIDAIRPGEDQHITSRGEMTQTLLDGSFTILHGHSRRCTLSLPRAVALNRRKPEGPS